jgi:hypothetical protein
MLVPCIALIDEDNGGYCNHVKWAEFRDAYPHRPFCLLVPEYEYNDDEYVYNDIGIPPNAYDDPLFQVHYVIRDEGNATADNWFDLCGLGELGSANVPFLGLFVDGSGSMDKSTVANSYNKFLADVAEAGDTICEVHNGDEDWIKPFMTTLTPTGGQCDEPKPYEETTWPTPFPTLTRRPTQSPSPTWDYNPWPTMPPSITSRPTESHYPTWDWNTSYPMPSPTMSPQPTFCASPVWIPQSTTFPTSEGTSTTVPTKSPHQKSLA